MWEKLGFIYNANGGKGQITHAQNPFPVFLNEHTLRVYITSRDEKGRSVGAWCDLDLNNSFQVIQSSQEPLLLPGPLGTFDDAGAMPHCIHQIDGKYYLYYTGWMLGVTVPFYFYVGLAVSDSLNGPFEKYSAAPILGRNPYDPILTGAPYVVKLEKGYRMYYVSCDRWEKVGEELTHYYAIKWAYSEDGITWMPDKEYCISLDEGEHAMARPVVLPSKEGYTMWFSYRRKNSTYRLAEATSIDGLNWNRIGDVAIDPSAEGWDSEMICYGHPFEWKGEQYMLYNGNGYGRSGFGIAKRRSQ